MPGDKGSKVRVGFIGAGGHAMSSIYPSLRFAPIDLVAVADLNLELANRAADLFGQDARVYRSHEELLRHEDIDAAIVVGPPSMHATVGIDILSAGRHLFVEKPPAATLPEAESLRNAALAAEKQVMVGFMKRFARGYRRAWEISNQDAFGELNLLRMNYAHISYPDFREHLIYMSIHPLDLTRYFMGEVVGGSVHRVDHQLGRVLIVTLQHESGGVSELNLSGTAPRVQEALELYGDCTKVSVDNLSRLTFQRRASTWEDAVMTDESMAQAWEVDLTINTPENNSASLQGYAGELRHFAECLLTQSPVRPNIDDGIAAMGIVERLLLAPQGPSTLADLEV